jgi:hypothetical protein
LAISQVIQAFWRITVNKNTCFQPRVFLGYQILITGELSFREVIKIHVRFEWQLHGRVISAGKKKPPNPEGMVVKLLNTL